MKMKKRDDWWKALAGLAVLAVVAVGLGLLFRGQRPAPEVAQTTETATATCTPAPTTTPAPTETPATPEGTPPPRHLSAAVEVPVQNPEGFGPMHLCGDTMVGDTLINGEQQLVTLDLTTGEMRQISSAPGTTVKYFARISESWVVWIEQEANPPDGPLERQLKVYDREKQREFTLEAAAPSSLDLAGDMVVWEGGGDVFAHNLRTGQRWTVAGRPNTQWYPHISGRWVIYLDWAVPADQPGVDLWAYNLESGEDRLVGQEYYPLTSSAGTYHALSGSRVVWTTPMGADYTFQVLSLDLDNPQDQPSVVMSPGDFAPESLHLFDDILVYHRQRGKMLYDVQQREELAFINPPLGTVVRDVFVSGDLVVWATTDGRLHTARIEQ